MFTIAAPRRYRIRPILWCTVCVQCVLHRHKIYTIVESSRQRQRQRQAGRLKRGSRLINGVQKQRRTKETANEDWDVVKLRVVVPWSHEFERHKGSLQSLALKMANAEHVLHIVLNHMLVSNIKLNANMSQMRVASFAKYLYPWLLW